MADRTATADPQPPELEPIENAGFRDLDPDGVLEQPFLERYNKHLEMPLGWALAVFFYVCLAGLFVLIATVFTARIDTKPVPISTLDGPDDAGLGNRNAGGEDIPLNAAPAAADIDRLTKNVPDLNQVRDDIEKQFKIDVGEGVEIPDSTAIPLIALDKTIRDKLMGAAKKGSGDGTQPGAHGPGAADTTKARGLRWILKFDTRSGRDYLNQLAAMKAVILVPTPDGKKMYIFRDLINPKPGTLASDADLDGMANQIQFSDMRQKSVEAVAEALGVQGYTPLAFWAFFPKGMEQRLADLEVRYRNKRPEDVRQTTFRVVIRGGEVDLIVIDQQMK